MNKYEIEICGVSKFYTRGRERVSVLDNINIQIDKGEFISIMGPSGSGKSTLLNLIGGIDTPNSGTIIIKGIQLDKYSDRQLSKWRARNIGFVFQSYNLIPVLSAEDNVGLPLVLTKLNRAEQKKHIATALEVVGLSDRAKHKPSELSGGQQQRVAIARALVTDTNIIVCDEPTGDLDRNTADHILDLLQTLNETHGKTIIMVTHDPKAASRANRTLIMDKGNIEVSL